MKTKNMRKKALIASVAMLLVAVVALSGATYAWFSANTAAKAQGLSFTSSQPSSLLFADVDADPTDDTLWKGIYDLDTTNTTLTPCSAAISNAGALTDFIEVKDVEAGATAGQVNTIVKSIGSGGSTKQVSFDVKSTADNTPLYVKSITASTNANISPAMRIAVKVGSNPVKIFVLGSKQTTYAVTAVDDDTYAGTSTFAQFYLAQADNITGITKAQQVITDVNSSDAQVATLSANTPQTIVVTVWLEGNDSRCNNDAMGQTINSFVLNFGTSLT